MDEQPPKNHQNPTSFIHNPNILAVGIAGILSACIAHIEWLNPFQVIINTMIPVVSMLLAYIVALLTAKLYTFTPAEIRAISLLNKRAKIIKKDLQQEYLTAEAKQALEKELSQIIIDKSKIGKSDTRVG